MTPAVLRASHEDNVAWGTGPAAEASAVCRAALAAWLGYANCADHAQKAGVSVRKLQACVSEVRGETRRGNRKFVEEEGAHAR